MAYPKQSYSVPIGAFDEFDQPAAGVFSVHEMDMGPKMRVSCLCLIWSYDTIPLYTLYVHAAHFPTAILATCYTVLIYALGLIKNHLVPLYVCMCSFCAF